MTQRPTPKRGLRRQTAVRLFGTLLALGLLVYLLSQQGWDEIIAAIRQIPLWRLVLALALMFISRLAVAARWHVLLQTLDRKIPFSRSLKITFAGLFASNFLPTTIGGDVVRLAGAIQYRLDGAASAASLVVDRLVGMAGMAMMTPFSLPGLFDELVHSASWRASAQHTWLNTGETSFARMRFALTMLPLGKWAKPVLPKLVSPTMVLEKVRRLGAKLYQAMTLWLKQPRSLLVSLLYSWIHMLCLFFILQLLLGGIGQNMPLWLIGGLYSLVYFVTLIPVSINGYGLQEVSMTLIFSNFGKASLSDGLTIAILFRTLMLLASLPGAIALPDILSTTKQTDLAARADETGFANPEA